MIRYYSTEKKKILLSTATKHKLPAGGGTHTRKGQVYCLSSRRDALLKRTSESNFNLNTYLDVIESTSYGALTAYSWASKPMAYVPKTARGMISLAFSIHCCPKFFKFILPDQRLYTVRNMCISECLEILYELPLLPNNTMGETFLHSAKC